MNQNEYYKVIGRITYSFTLIDFLLSTVAADLGITKTPFEFFSINYYDNKIKKLNTAIGKLPDNHLKQQWLKWLVEFDQLRIKRNEIVHCITLKSMVSDDEYKLYNYHQIKNDFISQVRNYSSDDFREVDLKLIDIHNRGHILWLKLREKLKKGNLLR